MKGVTRTAWTLIIGPHTFKKHRNKNNISYFSCNDCLRDKKTITAITEHEFGEDEHGADDNFTLIHEWNNMYVKYLVLKLPSKLQGIK